MRRCEHQSGFGAIETLLVIVAVGIIGTAGWFVYQHNRTKATNAAANPSNQQTQQTTTTTPVSTVNYLDVKEWGVKIPLSNNIKDAYYVVSTGSYDPSTKEPNTMWLGLTSLNTDGCDATKANASGASTISTVGALGRALPTDHDPVKGTLYTQLYPGVTIGKYYYFYMSETSGKACATQASLQSADSAFATAAKGTAPSTATAN